MRYSFLMATRGHRPALERMEDAIRAVLPAGTPVHVSPSRAAVADAELGWIDETGAAEVSLPGLVVSRSGRREAKTEPTPRWTPSVIGTAEALLLGTRPTVAEVERVAGLSAGAATQHSANGSQ